MDTPAETPSLSYPQLFSFQISYSSRSDCRNSVIPEGLKKGEWRHGVLEVDFSTETFFVQDRDRILLSQPFFMFDKHADFSSSEGCSLALKFNSDQWDILLQNISEKACVQHLLECIIVSMSIEEVVESGEGKGITGLDNSIIKQGRVQQKSASQNRLDERYIVLVPGKLLVFKSHNIKGMHVRYVTSTLGATVRMLPEEHEFQILAPGSKTLSLIPENPEELHSWVEALATSTSYAKMQAASIRRDEEKKLQITVNDNTEYQDPNGKVTSRNQIGTSNKDSRSDVSQPSFSEAKNIANNASTKEVQNDATFQNQGGLGMQLENKDVKRFYHSKSYSRQSKAMMYLENALDEMENTVSSVKRLAVSHRVNIEKNMNTTISGTLKERDTQWNRWKKSAFTGEMRVPSISSINQTRTKWSRSGEYEPSLSVRHSIDGISFTARDRDLPASAAYGKSSRCDRSQRRQNNNFEIRESYSGTGLYSGLPVPNLTPRRSTGLQRDPFNGISLRNCNQELSGEDIIYGQRSDRKNTCILKSRISNNMQHHVSASSSSEDEDDGDLREIIDQSSRIHDKMRIREDGNQCIDTVYMGNTSNEKQSSIQSRQTSTDCSSVRISSKLDENESSNQHMESSARYQSRVHPVIYPSQHFQQYDASKESCGVAEAYDDFSVRYTMNQTMAPSISTSVDRQTITNNQTSNYSFHSSPAMNHNPNTEWSPLDYQKGASMRLDGTPGSEFMKEQNAQAGNNEPKILKDPIYDPDFRGPQIISKKLNRGMQHETAPYGVGNLHPDHGLEHSYLNEETVPSTHGQFRNEPLPDSRREVRDPRYVPMNPINDNSNLMQNADFRVRYLRPQSTRTFNSGSAESWQQNQNFNEPDHQVAGIANSRGYPQRREATTKENNPLNRHHAIDLPLDDFTGGVVDSGDANAQLWWPSSRTVTHSRTEQAVMTRTARSGVVQGWPLPDSMHSNPRINHAENRETVMENLDASMMMGARRT